MKEKQALEKLFSLPERFVDLFRRKEYAQALYLYNTARTVALFLEVSEDKKKNLFGSRQQDPAVEGMFPEQMVLKCIEEVEIRRKDEREKILWDRFVRGQK